jgi:hypothetical protein
MQNSGTSILLTFMHFIILILFDLEDLLYFNKQTNIINFFFDMYYCDKKNYKNKILYFVYTNTINPYQLCGSFDKYPYYFDIKQKTNNLNYSFAKPYPHLMD